MAIIDVIKVLENDQLDEEQIAKVLRDLMDAGLVVDYYFVVNQKLWQVVIAYGNDVQYFGSGSTLILALANGLNDWYQDQAHE